MKKYYIFEGNGSYREIDEKEGEEMYKSEEMYARKCIYKFGDNIIFARAEVDATKIMNNIMNNAGYSVMTTFEKYRIYSYIAITISMLAFAFIGYLNYQNIGAFNDYVVKNDVSIENINKDIKYSINVLDLIGEKAKIDKGSIKSDEELKKEITQQILSGTNK